MFLMQKSTRKLLSWKTFDFNVFFILSFKIMKVNLAVYLIVFKIIDWTAE